ncbi:MAG TPA: hypothetical protein DEB24_03255 [Coriobacteriia bacterium]|nr:hypothetical protein [Coriobacteriia bacterium]
MIVSDVIVIGGGASGLVAAIAAAREGASVILLEKQDRVGKTILATGNGRCNLSNTAIKRYEDCDTGGIDFYNSPFFVAYQLGVFDCERICGFFKEIGLLTIVDEKGWVFPRTRHAGSVVDVLLRECEELGVIMHTNYEAERIVPEKGDREDPGCRWSIWGNQSGSGCIFNTRSLVVCSGNPDSVYDLTVDLDIAVRRQEPVLGPLPVDPAVIRGLDGVRVNACVSLYAGTKELAREEGEVLFKKQELSGIVVFNLSRFATPRNQLRLDMFPEYSAGDLEQIFLRRVARSNALEIRRTTEPESSLESGSRPIEPMPLSCLLKGAVHSRVAQAVIRKSGLDPAGDPTPEAIRKVVRVLKDFQIPITGGVDKNRAQVMRGGLSTRAFDHVTLASQLHPSLFAAGECLDVDGACGGFNLHWAWASGLTAGKEAARSAKTAYLINT